MAANPETRALLLLTSLNILDYLDRYLVGALGGPIQAELHLSGKAFGFLNTAFLLVYFLSSPIFGYLGDQYGQRRLMAGGAVLWSLATSLTYWVTSYPALLVTRGLVGVGEASFGTLAPAYLGDILPRDHRPRALGLLYLAIPLGAALAYLLGGFIGKYWGWRPAFLLAGLPGLFLAGAVSRLPSPALPASDLDPPPPSPLATALATAVILWRLPTLRRVTLGYGMLTFTLGGLAFWMPQYLEQAKGLNLDQANYLLFGALAGAGTLGTLVGGLLGSRMSRVTSAAPLWVSGLGLTLAWPLAALVLVSPQPAIYIPSLVASIFLLFLHPGVLTAVIVTVSGPRRRAQAMALNIIVIHLVGDAPATFLIGWTADHFGLFWGVGLTLVSLALAAGLIWGALPHLKHDLAGFSDS